MEDAVPASNSGSSGQVVVAGAGYAGLHVALRPTPEYRFKDLRCGECRPTVSDESTGGGNVGGFPV